jgi:hypothetical protein
VAGGVLVAVAIALVARPWGDGGARRDDSVRVPRGAGGAATLVLDARGGRVLLTGDAPAGALLDARGAGDDATATHAATAGEHDVRVTGATTTIRLSPDVRWTLRMTVGADDADLNLAGLDVQAVEVAGGAAVLAVALPPADGASRAEVSAGTDDLRFRLARGDAARVTVESGVGWVALDGDRTGGLGAGGALTTAGFDAEADHWELVVAGGAGGVTVERLP